MFSDGTVECKSHETGFLKKRIKCHPGGQSATEGFKNIAYVSMYHGTKSAMIWKAYLCLSL